MISLLVPLVVIAVVIWAIRRSSTQPDSTPGDPHAIRRVFQYAVLFGLLVVVAVGASGLLGRLLDRDVLVAGDEATLARELSFVAVGAPLLAGLAVWCRRRLLHDPGEARSLVWSLYVGVAALTSLVVAATAVEQVLRWAVGLEEWSGAALARSLVWGLVWAGHWWLDLRLTPAGNARLHLLAGSLIALVIAATAVGTVLLGALRILVGLEGSQVLVTEESPLLRGTVLLVVWGPVWLLYWSRAARGARDVWWFTYVLLAGVGGSLVTAVVWGSGLLYTALVWVLGETGTASALEHFDGAPAGAAGLVVGGTVWWYHREVLSEQGTTTRGELRRLYEYLVAAIGLTAAAAGLVLVVAALLEALSGDLLVEDAPLNTLLGAVTALVVGGSLWWLHWGMVRRAVVTDGVAEVTSLVRRVYLVVLFGVGAVAAVIALIAGVYLLFTDVVEETVGLETLRRMRFALGVLATTAAVAGYHGSVYLADRARRPAAPEASPRSGPAYVLLVGPEDAGIAEAVARRTHARVQAWVSTRDGLPPWSADDVVAALEASPADEVLVLAEPAGLRTIPVRRR